MTIAVGVRFQRAAGPFGNWESLREKQALAILQLPAAADRLDVNRQSWIPVVQKPIDGAKLAINFYVCPSYIPGDSVTAQTISTDGRQNTSHRMDQVVPGANLPPPFLIVSCCPPPQEASCSERGDKGLGAPPTSVRLRSWVGGMTPVLIKRYAGRRLYDTVSLKYVTLDDLSRRLLDSVRFVVRDAETGEDLTPVILDRLQ
jgi:PHB accumulation regulatory protein